MSDIWSVNKKLEMDNETHTNGEKHHVELTDVQKEDLIKQAKDIQISFEQSETEHAKPEATFVYLLSKQWFDSWKHYVSYDAVTSGNPPDNLFGQNKPRTINEDIVVANPQNYVIFEDDDYRNVVLRDGLQPETDYILVTEDLWEKLESEYPHITVKRPQYTSPEGQKDVEVKLRQLNVIFVNNALFQDIDHKRVPKFTQYKLQVSAKNTVQELKDDLIKLLSVSHHKKYFTKHPSYETVKHDQIRIWKLDNKLVLQQEFDRIQELCRKSTSIEYKIPFEGEYISGDDTKRFEELNIVETDQLFIELQLSSHNWNLVNPAVPTMLRCDGCMKYSFLEFPCLCKKADYCSEECRSKDLKYHISRCEKAEELNDSEKLVQNEKSRLGLVGLQNLGNTCFMNGALQCLSNFKELCQYFLLSQYNQEINETNPLGTKGKLAKQFANVVKNLWFGSASSFAPYTFKTCIARFQPMFGGYQQHDSQEFLNFLLDGLHEDLNRVKNKPFVETLPSENLPDHVIGLKSWINHIKRNQSVIVDLLHGQYKSQLTCPECQKVSTIFDPFMSVSVPIPSKKERDIDVFYLHSDSHKKPFRFNLKFPKENHYLSDLKRTIASYVEKDPSEFFFAYLTHIGVEFVTDEAGTLTTNARKKKRSKALFAVELSPEDTAMVPGDYLDTEVSITKKPSYNGGTRKTLTFMRVIRLRKSYTVREVYKKAFSLIRFLYNQCYPGKKAEDFETRNKEFKELSDEEAFREIYEVPEKKPFKIMLITNTRGFKECFFCGEKYCDNCEMPFDASKTLEADVLSKIKDENFTFGIELYYENIPDYIDTDKFNACADFFNTGKHKQNDTEKTEKMTVEESGIAIQECLSDFEKPEQLGPDNEWYCAECKKHQRAFKKLEIYKAPPILIVHLKRFKVKPGMMSKTKIDEKVRFPVDDGYLDMGPFVRNHQLPMDYPHLTEILNQTPKEESKEGSTNGNEKENVMDIEDETAKPSAKDQKMEALETNGIETNGNGANATENNGVAEQQQLPYQLFGVINHFGNLGFGHYSAYGKNWHDNQWYRFDDSNVSPAKADEICSPASYVLFYRKVDFDFKLPPLELRKMPERPTENTIIPFSDKSKIDDVDY